VATDLFDYLEWQQRPAGTAGQVVVRLGGGRAAAPATMNRRIAAVRGLFEFAVMTGARAENPVPAARRSTGLRPSRRGLLGHIGPGRPRGGGRLVRQPQRLPEALEPQDVAAFVADLLTSRDRAMTLLMLLGGLRAAEVRSLRLADVDMGLRRVRVTLPRTGGSPHGRRRRRRCGCGSPRRRIGLSTRSGLCVFSISR
jgi:integrase/recombinase XerC